MNTVIYERLFKPDRKPWGDDSFGIFTVSHQPQTACVFVHGWGGDARETWFGFPSRLRGAGADSDFYFYDYDSLRKTAAYSAAKFREFLHAVLTDPQRDIVRPSAIIGGGVPITRSVGFEYPRLVLCCHSLGAVVARRALIDLEKNKPGIISDRDVRMIMFAPAHSGSDLAQLAQELFSFGVLQIPLALAGKIAMLKFKSLNDLAPASQTLSLLVDDNRTLSDRIRESRNAAPSYLPKVFHAANDFVVNQDDFPGDDPFTAIDAHNHTSLCKPNFGYDLPVRELMRML